MYDSSENQSNSNNEFEISSIINILLAKKALILSFSMIFFILALIVSLNISDKYRSKALLAPSAQSESPSSMLGSYSAIAGIAGLNIPQSPQNKSQEALKRLSSFEFFVSSFYPFINKEDLIAAEGWDKESNTIKYDKRIFDPAIKEKNDFVISAFSEQEAFEIFSEFFIINEEDRDGFLMISVDHFSPYVSKEWLELIIRNINESMREIDKKAAVDAIDFLNAKLLENNLSEIDDVISKILESQMQTLMMASISNDYVFKIIDKPVAPEKRIYPNRIRIILFGFILGFVSGCLIVLLRHFFIYKD